MTIIHHASQLITLRGGPRRGNHLSDLAIIEQGAVLFRNGLIEQVGTSEELLQAYPNEERIDADNRVVMPGFVDPHTHVAWAGDRSHEFTLRQLGKPYMEILAAGGGILSTVNATRNTSLFDLMEQTRRRTARMFSYGTTTAEVKTGYGLDSTTELRQLEVIVKLNAEGPLEMIPTYMGAHAFPVEFKDNPQGYVDLICNQVLQNVKTWWENNQPGKRLPFVDVFCERGAFSLEQTRQIFIAATQLGFTLTIHADEFENLGGAALAVEFGAASANHLVKTSSAEIASLAKSNTVAVSLPGTPFGLAGSQYTPARDIIQADGLFALASDCNPGASWNENMQFIIALACRYMKITPAEAISAATINAAAALRMDAKIGSLEVGKQADMLILTESNYQMLGYRYGTNLVSKIIKKGQEYPIQSC